MGLSAKGLWAYIKPWVTVNPTSREAVIGPKFRSPAPASQLIVEHTPRATVSTTYFPRDLRRNIVPPIVITQADVESIEFSDTSAPPPGPGFPPMHKCKDQPPCDGYFPIYNVS